MGRTYFKLDGALELTAGYHPTERALSHPDTEHGPYPIRSYAELEVHLISWGITVTPEMREQIEQTEAT
jgi:hypothetical protein